MTNIETIYLDSNICRYPHEVRQFGPYRGLAIDLLVWTAKATFNPSFRHEPKAFVSPAEVTFHATDFYQVFGHSPGSLSQPLTAGGAGIFRYREQYRKDYGRTVLDATLFAMSVTNIAYYTGREYRIANVRRETVKELTSLGVFRDLIIARKARSFVRYSMKVNPQFVSNNHYLSQLITMADYTSLRTPGTEKQPAGTSWTVGRFLYLRMRYAWGLWCSKDNKGKGKFTENFQELMEIAGFEKTDPKKAASLLRGYLKKVCTLASVPFTAEVVKMDAAGQRDANGKFVDEYQVVLTKKPAQVKLEAEELKQQQNKQTQLAFQKQLGAVAKGMRG